MTAIVVLGMHRSGTSCIAGMLAAGGLASAGEAVRNWDNARGHHEMLDLIRLDEAVLAHSGGHWLAAPADVRWTAAHAEARDRILASTIDGRPALLKDPRMLLVLPFWRESRVPFRVVGVVRHPLAVARSLEAWREMPLADAIALWIEHDRRLLADRDHHHYPMVDFERSKTDVVGVLAAAFPSLDVDAAGAAYEGQFVHHDAREPAANIDDAVALYRAIAGEVAAPETWWRSRYPLQSMAAFRAALRAGDVDGALGHARDALAIADPAAVLVPVVTALIRDRAHAAATALIGTQATRLDPGLAALLEAKVLLAAGDAAAAVTCLEVACASPDPYFQARQLLPQALRGAGRHVEARAALQRVANQALYPHNPLATLAEWSWLDGDRDRALVEIAEAIAAAPPHRRGRLRTRRAEWLVAIGQVADARTELAQAIAEDPGYARSHEVLASLVGSR